MSILLLGAEGQVGQELQRSLTCLIPKMGPIIALGRAQLDLTDLAAIAAKIKAIAPTLIVNSAAYTAVDNAESEPQLAYRINAEAPGAIARSAQACGATLIHISTDYVFPGHDGSPRVESDPTGPLSVYGKTKLAGEVAIRAALERHIILRTAWVYGCYGKSNFVKTMIRLAKEQSSLSVVNDQIGSPTWATDIATAIAQLADKPQHSPGTYHFTSIGIASWYDFAVAIFENARALGIPLAIETVTPIATANYPTPAQRPAYSVLNCQKLTDVLGYTAPPWRDSLRQMLQQYVQLNPSLKMDK
ncbi:MAG: dTDP-4-dehydrorhamnose reductase [Cyanobacteria bacterium J06621_3]